MTRHAQGQREKKRLFSGNKKIRDSTRKNTASQKNAIEYDAHGFVEEASMSGCLWVGSRASDENLSEIVFAKE